MVRNGARDYYICSIAWSSVLASRTKGCSIFAGSVAPASSAPRLQALQTGQQLLYALDEQVRRHEVTAK
jgi:hypothetical protein